MKKIIISMILLISVNLIAGDINPKEIADNLEINPKSKVMKQWDRVFKSKLKKERYGINSLSKEEQKALKDYLINNAKDSDTAEGCASDL